MFSDFLDCSVDFMKMLVQHEIVLVMLRKICLAVLNKLIPHVCCHCGKIGTVLCALCHEKMVFSHQLELAQLPAFRDTHFENITIQALGKYQGVLRSVVTQFKYGQITELGTIAGNLIYDCLVIPEADLVTYIPLHRKKEKIRGYSQTKILANFLAKKINRPCIKLLEKKHHTLAQASGKQEQRFELSGNTFKYMYPENVASPKNIILIDDVITTGSTVKVAIETIRKHSNCQIHVVAIAC